jgi:hypothetical protein
MNLQRHPLPLLFFPISSSALSSTLRDPPAIKEWIMEKRPPYVRGQPNRAASNVARPKRWTSNGTRPNSNVNENARRNYERYIELARTEAQAGNLVDAENYYQHAEHYYRTMNADPTS